MVSPEDFEEAVRAVETIPAGAQGHEDALRYLRGVGLSIVQSMRVLMRVHGYPLAEAKEIVHTSDAWADQRTVNEEFHENLIRAVEAELATNENQEEP